MYVSCSSLACTLEAYPRIQDTVAQIKELGFQAFDLTAFEGWQNVDPSTLVEGNETWKREFIDAIAASGMRVSSFNAQPSRPITDPDPAAFARYKLEFRTLLDLAGRVGCPNITVQPGNPIKGHSSAKLFDTARAHLSELAPLSAECNVTLSVEAHMGSLLESPDDTLRMMKALWPSVGLTYDPSHFVMQGMSVQETEPLLEYTMHVHVRNASLGKMQDTMEDGTVDFGWLVPSLRDHGYNGAVTIEYFAGFDRGFRNTVALREVLMELGLEG